MSDYKLTPRSLRIAVAGATGRVGSRLIDALRRDPVRVIAFTRDPSGERIPRGVDRATVDFDSIDGLSNAMAGVDRLFISHGTSSRQAANEIALIDAAVATGVSHIVKLSVMGPPSRLHPFDWHMEIEAHLAKKNIGYTILRPTTFVDVLARAAGSVADGSWGGCAGEGRVNLIDTRDIADVARAVLLDQRHTTAQRAFHLTGPAPVTMSEIADELSRLLGSAVNYEHRTPEKQRELLIRSGVSEMVADILLGLDRLFMDSVQAEKTNTCATLTGKEPREASVWLAEHLDEFRRR